MKTKQLGTYPCGQTSCPNKKLCINYLSKAKIKRWGIDAMMPNPDGDENCKSFIKKEG